jgi:isoprenylcysteine carboxyl methyltransferase (ICMT) family protein YpbQ
MLWLNLHRLMMLVGAAAYLGTAVGFLSGYWPASSSLALNIVNVGETLGESLKHANAIEAALIIFAIVSTGWFTALVPVHLIALVQRIRVKKKGPYPFGDP